jgi:hypothetical protein
MPVKVLKLKGLYRLVEPTGRLARSVRGKAADGGGHVRMEKAYAQMGHVNKAWEEKNER